MAEVAKNSGKRAQPSRLQKRAPASLQIDRVSDWNVAIPLLSPLIQSPTSPDSDNLFAQIKAACNNKTKEESRKTEPEKPVTVAFKKWQHPAAPFCYEPPAPLVPFVCTGTVDR